MWHVWSVNTKQYKKLLRFLNSIDEIEDVLIPVSDEQAIDLRSGLLHNKKVPIYGNYVFVKYVNSDAVVSKLLRNPLFYQYIGTCSEEELDAVSKRDRDKNLMVGSKVKILKVPFDGVIGEVTAVEGTKVYISSKLNKALFEICCSLSEIEILDGG